MAHAADYADEQSQSGLSTYVGKDLRKLEAGAADEFWHSFRAATGEEPAEMKDFERFEPWSVNTFRAGEARWIFLAVYPGYNVPDVSAVRVHIFNQDWRLLTKQTFPTGYRFFLKEASVKWNAALKQHLLVVKVTSAGPFFVLPDGKKKPAFEQGDFQMQYYAFIDDRMALIRLEDDKKRLVRNSYRWSTPLKGGAIPNRSKDQWIESLSSDSVVNQLATLVWLSGSHLKSSEERHENVSQESIHDSRLFEAVRDSPQTKQCLNRLRDSNIAWIRDYTRLAVETLENDGRSTIDKTKSVIPLSFWPVGCILSSAVILLAIALGFWWRQRRTGA